MKVSTFAILLSFLAVSAAYAVVDDKKNTTTTTATTTTTTKAPKPTSPPSPSPNKTTTTTAAPTTTTAATTTTPANNPNHTTTTANPPAPSNGTTPSPVDPVGELSAAVLAGGWIPFVAVLGVAIVFSVAFVRHYEHRHDRECGSTVVAIMAIVVALLTASLVPVDVYLVSSYRYDNGTTQPWASDLVQASVTEIVTDAYYAMYALNVAFIFIFIPLSYFYYEAEDEEAGVTRCQRIMSGLKFTIGFVIVMGILMCIGAFALGSDGTICGDSLNESAIIDDVKCRAIYAEEALTKNGGTNAISFTIGFMTFVGVLYFIFYTGAGMVIMPIGMIRSRGRFKYDLLQAEQELGATAEKKAAINAKYAGKKGENELSRPPRAGAL